MGIFDGDPMKSNSPFDSGSPSGRVAGNDWVEGSSMPPEVAPEPDMHAATTPNIGNLELEGFPKFGTCMKAMRELEAAQLRLSVIRDQIDTFCGEYGDEELCDIAKANLRIAQGALNSARQAVELACMKAI